jgi:ornithine--oxo-acid transaminase
VRGQGLLVGFEINANRTTARTVCEHLMDSGILTKETHETVVRLAPPLIIDRDMIDDALTTLSDTLASLGK